MEGRYVVNAEGFWGEMGIFRSAFTRGMRRVAFSCKRGKGRGQLDRIQRAMGLEPIGNGPGARYGGAGTDPPVRDAAGTKRRGRRVYEFGRVP